MKNFIFFFMLFLISGAAINAQKSSFKLQNDKIYWAVINKDVRHWLGNMNDSSVMLVVYPQQFGRGDGVVYKYSDIETIGFLQKGDPDKGFVWGALSGAVGGALLGVILGRDYGPAVNAMAGGILGILPGGLIGMVIKSIKHNYHIGRQKQAFSDMYTQIANK